MKKIVFILACIAVLVAMVIPVFATGATEVTTAQQLKDALEAGEMVKLAADIDVGEFTGSAISVPNNVSAGLDLNGYTLSGVKTGTANGEVIKVGFGAALEVSDSVGTGAIKVSSTDDGEWGCYTAAIAVNGNLTVNGGSIINEGGTSMSYAIDVLANSSAGPSATIKGGLVKSPYIAIRGFVNNTTSGVLTINVENGVVEGGNRGIWIQQPNSNAGKNFAAVNVSDGYIYGGKAAIDVYMATTADANNASPEVTVTITGGVFVNNNRDVPTIVITGSSTSMTVPIYIENAVLYGEQLGHHIGDRRDYGPSDYSGPAQFSLGEGVSCNGRVDYSLVVSYDDEVEYITDKPAKGVYNIDTFGLSNLSLDGNPVAYEGVSYVGKLVVTGGSDFTLPNDITVKVNGNEIKGFTYNATTGEIIIDASEITGEIAIEAQAICTENIVVDDNGTATVPDSIVDVEEGKDVVIEIIIPSVDDNTGSDDNTGDGDDEGTGSDTPVTPVEPPKVESVVIGSETVEKITQAEVNVEIKLPEITVSFDKEAIDSIGEQSQSKDVTIVATEVEKETLNDEQKAVLEEKEVHLVLKLEVHAEDEKITEFGGGKVTISVPFEIPEGKDASEFTVAYIADDGTVTIMPTSFENGVLSFETTHFSKYVVMETAAIDNPVTSDNTMFYAVIAMLVISMAVIAVAAVSKKRCM